MTQSKREFSKPMQGAHPKALADFKPAKTLRVGFVLLDNFSLMSYASAVDALVTANLVTGKRLFSHSNYSVTQQVVASDLSVDLSADGYVHHIDTDASGRGLDALIVVGGYRTPLTFDPSLLDKLKQAAGAGLLLGGLWNGSLAIASAGLLDQSACAVHPDNHALLREKFPKVRLADQSWTRSGNRLTAAGPSSTLEMMLDWISEISDEPIANAVREILAPDSLSNTRMNASSMLQNDPSLPETLRSLIQLMRANIEEPLSSEELASCVNLSRRQVERLFQSHLGTSPSRYYFELRLTQAERLLSQTSDSITRISLACGFVSSSHFSTCFKDFFGESPSVARKRQREPRREA